MAVSPMKKIVFVLAFALAACNASAQWVLNNAASSVDFVSIKNTKVAELHSFENLQGSLEESGKARLTIALASVETQIPIRNERMQSMLFEVDKFPQASVSALVDFERISRMKAGQSFIHPATLKLSIHGDEQEVNADLRIVKLARNKLLVATVRPLIVNADDFSLSKGVEALREIAALSSISTAVPVTVSLVFEQ